MTPWQDHNPAESRAGDAAGRCGHAAHQGVEHLQQGVSTANQTYGLHLQRLRLLHPKFSLIWQAQNCDVVACAAANCFLNVC